MRILSFNVNGIRAIIQKSFYSDMKAINADVICLQETKATVQQVKDTLVQFSDYEIYANESKTRKGYSGTAILTKVKPLSVSYDMGIEEHDQEGRVITMEFENFYLIGVYTPNSGNGLVRLDYRKTWDEAFLAMMKELEKKKPVIVCGDLNVAHQAMDLANPKSNYNKTAGYTQIEIDGMDTYHANGYVDTYRWKNPDTVKYSWWSYRGGARERNVGWRIDYFLIAEALKERVRDIDILNEIHGSDHCPILLEID